MKWQIQNHIILKIEKSFTDKAIKYYKNILRKYLKISYK